VVANGDYNLGDIGRAIGLAGRITSVVAPTMTGGGASGDPVSLTISLLSAGTDAAYAVLADEQGDPEAPPLDTATQDIITLIHDCKDDVLGFLDNRFVRHIINSASDVMFDMLEDMLAGEGDAGGVEEGALADEGTPSPLNTDGIVSAFTSNVFARIRAKTDVKFADFLHDEVEIVFGFLDEVDIAAIMNAADDPLAMFNFGEAAVGFLGDHLPDSILMQELLLAAVNTAGNPATPIVYSDIDWVAEGQTLKSSITNFSHAYADLPEEGGIEAMFKEAQYEALRAELGGAVDGLLDLQLVTRSGILKTVVDNFTGDIGFSLADVDILEIKWAPLFETVHLLMVISDKKADETTKLMGDDVMPVIRSLRAQLDESGNDASGVIGALEKAMTQMVVDLNLVSVEKEELDEIGGLNITAEGNTVAIGALFDLLNDQTAFQGLNGSVDSAEQAAALTRVSLYLDRLSGSTDGTGEIVNKVVGFMFKLEGNDGDNLAALQNAITVAQLAIKAQSGTGFDVSDADEIIQTLQNNEVLVTYLETALYDTADSESGIPDQIVLSAEDQALVQAQIDAQRAALAANGTLTEEERAAQEALLDRIENLFGQMQSGGGD
ncbi:MAG: hypothetical protein LBM78_04015, partial [Clostridiales bacterium]|nr:hypothetical protein [Clostridiales bacterium]